MIRGLHRAQQTLTSEVHRGTWKPARRRWLPASRRKWFRSPCRDSWFVSASPIPYKTRAALGCDFAGEDQRRPGFLYAELHLSSPFALPPQTDKNGSLSVL